MNRHVFDIEKFTKDYGHPARHDPLATDEYVDKIPFVVYNEQVSK